MSGMTSSSEVWWFFLAMPDPWSDHPHGVVDGDTVDLYYDGGFKRFGRVRVRLRDVDTAEIYGVRKEEAELGHKQAAFVEAWMEEAADSWDGRWSLLIDTRGGERGKYGRLRATIRRREDLNLLSADLVNRWPSVYEE